MPEIGNYISLLSVVGLWIWYVVVARRLWQWGDLALTPDRIKVKRSIYMSNKILVTYASRAGSTQGVAEAIGKSLADGGAAVDVRPMRDVQDLTPYRAVVAGSERSKGAHGCRKPCNS